MSPVPDEKKHVIVSILDQLRPYQPALGSYIKSLYTTDFSYSVKLSNGRIRLPEELVDDYQADPSTITAQRYKNAASQFVPDSVPQAEPAPAPQSYWRTVLVIIVIIVAACIGYNAIKNNQAREIQAAARVNIYHQVVTERGNYMVNRLFGGISALKVTVTNNSEYLVDIVKIKVTYLKADGDVYKEEMLYFNRLAPHSTQTLGAPNSDRGTSVNVTRESLICSALAIN